MPGYYKITRPADSDRVIAFGIALRHAGDSFYVDHGEIAENFQSVGWPAEAVKDKPTDGIIYEVRKTESFQKLISELEKREKAKPKGEWECTAPPGFLRVFVFGYNTKKPFITDDYEKMVKFRDLGFNVKQISGMGEVEEPPASNEKVEGQDAPKGKPLSTYDLPKSAKGK